MGRYLHQSGGTTYVSTTWSVDMAANHNDGGWRLDVPLSIDSRRYNRIIEIVHLDRAPS